MGYSAYLDSDYAGDVATLSGWLEFTDWAEQFDSRHFVRLRQIAEFGVAPEPSELVKELEIALKSAEGDVLSVGQALLAAAKKNKKQHECMIVSQGVGAGDED